MNLIEKIKTNFQNFLDSKFNYNSVDAPVGFFEVNIDDSKKEFGDINSNIALLLSKQLGKNPREIATAIQSEFIDSNVEKIDIAGPGFINIFLKPEAFKALSKELYTEQENFYKTTPTEKKHYSIEFVSGNPTGPLHIGNGRGGIIGDVLGRVFKFLGHQTTAEYYINDAGVQMGKLGNSFKIRCLQELGQQVELPEESYKGEYLVDLAKEFVKEHGKTLEDKPEAYFAEYAEIKILEMIKSTLTDYGVDFDVWFSERSLHEDGSISKAVETLTTAGYTFESEGALWFKSTEFGDDKDRVIKKADGTYAYLAADIAYILNKVERGANQLIVILGQDHHSYATRLHGLHKALKLDNKSNLDVVLYQLVHLNASGELLKMSKRAGNIVTLREIIDTVGKDVARFFFLNRKADAQLDFDLDLALKKTDENPVFYIQYAYVRTNSILHKASTVDEFKDFNTASLENLDPSAAHLLKKIIHLKTLLTNIGQNLHTHLLSYYTLDLARAFHQYYSQNKVLDISDIKTSQARLALVKIVNENLKLCLQLLGLEQPEKM
jgi:arginyl-tRNA synthetase